MAAGGRGEYNLAKSSIYRTEPVRYCRYEVKEMIKRVFLLMLIVCMMPFSAGCGRVVVRTVCDCDCCECGGYEQDDRERYDDPGEYQGWGY